jgi:predicted small integral membrane protein
MVVRISKVVLVAAVAFYLTLVVINNVTDYDANYHFVQHVLSMDTTFADTHGMGRAIRSDLANRVAYGIIIAWEALSALLSWWAAANLIRRIKANAAAFNRAKDLAVAALTLSLLQWFLAFISIGGEWFLMWQSKLWNGLDSAFRMFACVGIVLIFLILPESDAHE